MLEAAPARGEGLNLSRFGSTFGWDLGTKVIAAIEAVPPPLALSTLLRGWKKSSDSSRVKRVEQRGKGTNKVGLAFHLRRKCRNGVVRGFLLV